jgi:excinuclease ABC subunit A
MDDAILIRGARLHNLKNLTVSIPKNKLVALSGLSGSGKSTLAFDTLHREGQRQYLESLGMVTYAARPQVDSITGLSPSISVDQRYLTNRSPRSTVGTATEVFTYLRVLWARIGHRPCPACGRDIPPEYHVTGDEAWDDEPAGGEPDEAPEGEQTLPCPTAGRRCPRWAWRTSRSTSPPARAPPAPASAPCCGPTCTAWSTTSAPSPGAPCSAGTRCSPSATWRPCTPPRSTTASSSTRRRP